MFNVDEFVRSLEIKYDGDEYKWIKITSALQSKLQELVWYMEAQK